MTNTAAEKSAPAAGSATSSHGAGVSQRTEGGVLHSEHGRTMIADVVVQKIAGIAAREVAGIRDLGGGASRTFGALRERIPGAGTSHGRGITVEVGERQVAVDLDVLVDYGVAIPDLARSVRKNVMTAIERMTGLEVVEVNITVDDIFLGGDGDDSLPQVARVE